VAMQTDPPKVHQSEPPVGPSFGSRSILDSLEAFSDVAASLSGVSEVGEICDRVVDVLKAGLGLRSCSVMLLSEDGKTLSNVAGTSPRSADAPSPASHRSFRVGEGIAGTVASRGEAILVSDADRDERFTGSAGPVRVRSLLCLPIGAGGGTLGVLNLSHAEPEFFSHEHRTVFTILSTILGKLISEARLRQKLSAFNQDLERQVAERTREIQASHAYLEKIFSQASDIILSVDWRGRVTFVNRRVAELGYDPERLIGQPFSVLCRDACLPPGLIDAMAGATLRNVELALCGPGGEGMDSYCSFSPLEDSAGGGQGALVLVRDVTGTKQLEAQVRQMDKLTSIGTLVSGIAHEINNKLVPILVYSELLQRTDMSEKDLRLIQTVHKSATGARHIMDSLLRFSRQEAPKKQCCSLNQVVHDVVGMVQYRGKKQDVEVICRLDEGLPDVFMDAQQIAQVVLNIVNNAYDAMIEQSGRIEMTTAVVGERLCLTIADNGPGIPEALQQRVFDPFFTTKEVGKGTGLGLSLCYGIVQEHQGEIVLTSDGEGTRFEVWLPQSGPPAQVIPRDAKLVAPSPEVLGTLLVAGDDPVLVEVLEHVLGEHHTVVRAAGGREVMAYLAEHQGADTNNPPIDALVLDLKLPDMGGDQVLDWLEGHHPDLSRRVVFLSADPDEVARRLGDRVAPERVIFKPFRATEVRTVVDRLLATGG